MNAVQQNRVSGIPALAILLGFRRVHVRPDPNNSEGWAILAVAGETELELAGSLVRVNTTNFSSSDLLFVPQSLICVASHVRPPAHTNPRPS